MRARLPFFSLGRPSRSLWLLLVGCCGLAMAQDPVAPGARTHQVTVVNNFFSPESLTIAVGDSVQWFNASGFHNVFSCIPEQTGCGTASNETFTSGPPAGPPWIYTYTFTEAGENPYICQSHAPNMTGLVTVIDTPPTVPDGGIGAPMTVARLDPAGSALNLSWDDTTCSALDHQIVYSVGSRLPSAPGGRYLLVGAECGVGGSPYTWTGVPNPGLDPTRLLWWLVLATDGAEAEGSWGTDSGGDERDGPAADGSSAKCSITAKELGNACGG